MSTDTGLTWADMQGDYASQLTTWEETLTHSVESLGRIRADLDREILIQQRETLATLKRLQRENMEIHKYSRELGLRLTLTIKAIRGLPKLYKITATLALNKDREAIGQFEGWAGRGDTFALELLALINDLDTFAQAFIAHQFAACVYTEPLDNTEPSRPAAFTSTQDFTPRLARDPKTFANAPSRTTAPKGLAGRKQKEELKI